MNLVIYRIYPSTPNERFYACTDINAGIAKYLCVNGKLFNPNEGHIIQFCNSKRDMIRFIKRYLQDVKIRFRL